MEVIWSLSFPQEELGKVIRSRPTFSFFAWKPLVTSSRRNAKKKSWIPVKSSKNGVVVSHIFFADDLVLFAKADHVNCSTIWDVLDDFCARSEQSISESKSRVFFPQMLMWILGSPCVIF